MIWMLIKADNPARITLTRASVDLQHGEIRCLNDASVRWPQKRTWNYRFGKSDNHEIIDDFDDMEKLGGILIG